MINLHYIHFEWSYHISTKLNTLYKKTKIRPIRKLSKINHPYPILLHTIFIHESILQFSNQLIDIGPPNSGHTLHITTNVLHPPFPSNSHHHSQWTFKFTPSTNTPLTQHSSPHQLYNRMFLSTFSMLPIMRPLSTVCRTNALASCSTKLTHQLIHHSKYYQHTPLEHRNLHK